MDTSTPSHRHRIHGLEIASTLPLPELADGGGGSADVHVIVGEVPQQLGSISAAGLQWQAGPGGFLFEVPGVARYLVTEGRRIVVQPLAAAGHAGDIRLYLLGTALGALLHQRGLLALHASAVVAPSGSWAFTGQSGAGKSTISAWLQQHHGCAALSDDVIVVDDSRPAPRLHAGPARVKLWRDALEALAIDTEGLARDLTRFDKFHLTRPAADADAAGNFRGLVLLETCEQAESAHVVPVQGREALAVVMASVYRAELSEVLRPPGALFLQAARLADRLQVLRFRRPRSMENFEGSLAPIFGPLGLT